MRVASSVWCGEQRAFALFCLLTIVSGGCGPSGEPTYPVTGKVLLADGQPVQFGTIEFNPVSGGPVATGAIAKDGSYRLTTSTPNDGAVAGKHQVIIVQIIQTDDLPLHEHDHGPTIALKYANYRDSDLEFVVSTDKRNEFTIEVEELAKRDTMDE